MIAAKLIAMLLLTGLVIGFEWPKMKGFKEKTVLSAMLALGLFFFLINQIMPELPGPSEWVEWLYNPLGQILTP